MPRILVVDDEPDQRFLLRRIFERAGHEVIGDGAAALRVVHESPPDLVVTDMMMPITDGTDSSGGCGMTRRRKAFRSWRRAATSTSPPRPTRSSPSRTCGNTYSRSRTACWKKDVVRYDAATDEGSRPGSGAQRRPGAGRGRGRGRRAGHRQDDHCPADLLRQRGHRPPRLERPAHPGPARPRRPTHRESRRTVLKPARAAIPWLRPDRAGA